MGRLMRIGVLAPLCMELARSRTDSRDLCARECLCTYVYLFVGDTVRTYAQHACPHASTHVHVCLCSRARGPSAVEAFENAELLQAFET
eukprot:7179629-Alexandrium_andersonii.AAC.1